MIFHVPWSLVLLSLYLKKQSPPLVFIGRFQERNTSFSSVRDSEAFSDLFFCVYYCLAFLVFFGGKYLRSSAFLWSCKARPAADNLLFAFLWMVLNTSLCAFSQTYRIRPAYCMCSLALSAIESMHRKLATGRGVYGWVIWSIEKACGLVGQTCSQGNPPWFMNGLLPEVHEMVFRVSVPLNALQEPWLLSPSHSLQTHPAI